MGAVSDALTDISDALGLKEPLDDLADSVGDWIRDNPELAAVTAGVLTGGLLGPEAGLLAGGMTYGGIQGRNQADAIKRAQKQRQAALEEAKRRQQALLNRRQMEQARAQRFADVASSSARQRAMAAMGSRGQFARGTLLTGGGMSDASLNLGRKTLLGQ